MKYVTLAKTTGIATFVAGCLLVNSFIKPKPANQELTNYTETTPKENKKTPLNDSTTMAAMFTLGLLSTGAFAKKAMKK